MDPADTKAPPVASFSINRFGARVIGTVPHNDTSIYFFEQTIIMINVVVAALFAQFSSQNLLVTF